MFYGRWSLPGKKVPLKMKSKRRMTPIMSYFYFFFCFAHSEIFFLICSDSLLDRH